MQHDTRSKTIALGSADAVTAGHVRLPHERRIAAAPPGNDAHLVGDHESGIESDAELSDEFRQICALVFLKRLAECLGTRRCDSAEIALQFLEIHTDAVVGDHQRPGLGVDSNLDCPLGIVRRKRSIGQSLELGLVDSV